MRLALSYAAFVVLAGLGLIAVVWVFLLRYVPDRAVVVPTDDAPGTRAHPGLFIPGRSDLWAAFAPKAGLMLGLLLAVGLIGGWVLAGRMLAPLHRITAATRAAGDGALSHRIALPGRSDEFRELADAFDTMLARLEAHVAAQRRFAANASHELRTPLSITRTVLEVAARDPDRDVEQVLAGLARLNGRAIDLTEALLLLSTAERGDVGTEEVDLSLAAEEAAETLLPLAERTGVAVTVSGDRAVVRGSTSLLAQMTTNLIHNAIVHNVAGGTVTVRTHASSAGARAVTLVVENTGDPLDPDVVVTLHEPFRRGTERVHHDQAGVGLGLAIVAAIVDAHGGSLTLTARTGGGLSVRVELPQSS